MTLDEMRKVDIRTVDPATLHDRRDVRIDSRQPREKRIASYLKQIGKVFRFCLHKHLLNPDKMFLGRQLIKIRTHSILHVGQQLSQTFGCAQCTF